MGGVGKYAQLIDKVPLYAPVQITSLCILGKHWWHDEEGLNDISARKIYIESRLDFSWIARVAIEIDALSPDLIMTHGFNGHCVALVTRFLTQKKSRLICSYHGSYHATTPGRKIFEMVFNAFTEAYIRHVAQACVSVAAFSKKHLVEKGVSPSKVEVIYNGIIDDQPSVTVGKRLRRDWGIGDHEIVIGAASRIDPVKGLQYLIAAFSELCKYRSNLKLVIVGSGIMEQRLNAMINGCGLSDKVIFTGFRADVPACLHIMDIFVLPSLAEYHSIALLEAMRAGKVIVATDVGGNTESVRHLQECLIVPAADAVALAGAIGRIIDDRSLANRLGKSARERFRKHFTDETMVRHTAQWFQECGPTAG
jgi:glycosyltransferase involved in cell wall biosynthesis